MEAVKIKTMFIEEEPVYLIPETYQATPKIVPRLRINGFSLEGEPMFEATVLVPGYNKPEFPFVALKGWSENSGLPEALERAGIVKLTQIKLAVGFAEAVVAEIVHPIFLAECRERLGLTFVDYPEKEFNPAKASENEELICSNCAEQCEIADRETGLCKDCFEARFTWQEKGENDGQENC